MANCAYHPGHNAIGACVKCFTLVCKECSTIKDGSIYCNPCLGKPVDSQVDESEKIMTPGGFITSGNTSGQGRLAQVPLDVLGLNWAAFMGTWIWGIANHVWISLLYLVPTVFSIVITVLVFSGAFSQAEIMIWMYRNEGLLTIVPFIQPVMGFILLFKGNKWAWQSKKWDSVEHFLRTQRTWRNWFIGIFIINLFLVSYLILVAMSNIVSITYTG